MNEEMTHLAPLFEHPVPNTALRQAYTALVETSSPLRRREVADKLAVPEAALIDQECGVRSVRLDSRFGDLIKTLPELGYIMTLTRNEHAVHERKGVYDNVRIGGVMGLVIAPDRKIDLRIILNRWVSGFAVQERAGDSYRYSLQFFDAQGTAIQKVFLQPESNTQAYQTLVETFGAAESNPVPLNFAAREPQAAFAADEQVDREALIKEWQAMTDVHQFFGMLKRHAVSREQAFRLVGEPLAQVISPSVLEPLLKQAAEKTLPIMCFVGNSGNIQIHTGPVKQIKRVGPWLNVLDPEFNLHLLEQGIVSGWLVRKPTEDGLVTSLEFYDADSNLVVQFFGLREEGSAENPQWKELAESLLKQGEAA